METSTILILLGIAIAALAAIPLVKRYTEPLALVALVLAIISIVGVLVR